MNGIIFSGYNYAFAAGFFGAAFFMIVELQARLSVSSQTELRHMWTFRMIALRCFFGIGASTVLYFFLQTNLIESPLWPNIHEIGFTDETKIVEGGFFSGSKYRFPDQDTSLLLIWSFLAGYSQTLVPNLISKTVDDTESQTKDNA